MFKRYLSLLILCLALILALPVTALAQADVVTTEHTLALSSGPLTYTAAVGLLTVEDASFGTTAQFSFVAYSLKGADSMTRPLTFAFNGGPGASSVYLHLLAMGPKRVVLNDDGTAPPGPAQLTPNEETWLKFTDIVFIDPIGTGWSKCLDCMGVGYKPYWGIMQDRNSVAAFIQTYLGWSQRGNSPLFMAGESYGGVRGPLLVNYMPRMDSPVNFKGLVLISPACDLGTAGSNGNNYNLLPFVTALPSYARVAQYHGVVEAVDYDAFVAEVEAFAVGEYLSGLALGEGMTEAQAASFYSRLNAYTGIDEALWRTVNGRMNAFRFSKELLRSQGLLTGWFDGTVTGPDPDPSSVNAATDVSSSLVTGLAGEVFGDYVSDELGYSNSDEYVLLNLDAEPNWDWSYPPTAQGDGQGWVVVGDELASAMELSSGMMVMIVGGHYDTIIPYSSQIQLVNHMPLTDAARANLTLNFYNGGHMVYTHKTGREEFTAALVDFYNQAVSTGGPRAGVE